MPPTTASQYAQLRRDEETNAREDLKSLIPAEYFLPEVENEGKYNITTKVLQAAKHYLQAQTQEKVTVASSQSNSPATSPSTKGKGKAKATDEDGAIPVRARDRTASEERRHHGMVQGQAITTALPSPFVNDIEEIRQLRQAARRLVQIAEGKADADGGVPGELKRSINQGSDLLIDLIKVIEREGWTDEQKRKWEAEHQKWAGKANVD